MCCILYTMYILPATERMMYTLACILYITTLWKTIYHIRARPSIPHKECERIIGAVAEIKSKLGSHLNPSLCRIPWPVNVDCQEGDKLKEPSHATDLSCRPSDLFDFLISWSQKTNLNPKLNRKVLKTQRKPVQGSHLRCKVFNITYSLTLLQSILQPYSA